MLPLQAIDARRKRIEDSSWSSKKGEKLQANPSQRSVPHVTSGELLARTTLWNLVGFLSPVAAAAAAVPVFIRGIGESRFGVLSIAWIVLGYLGFLDLGLSRALTKFAAERVGRPDEAGIVPIAWTSLLLLFFLGAFGGLITYAISPLLVYKALKVPTTLQTETCTAFSWWPPLYSHGDGNVGITWLTGGPSALQGLESDPDPNERLFFWRSFASVAIFAFPWCQYSAF